MVKNKAMCNNLGFIKSSCGIHYLKKMISVPLFAPIWYIICMYNTSKQNYVILYIYVHCSYEPVLKCINPSPLRKRRTLLLLKL